MANASLEDTGVGLALGHSLAPVDPSILALEEAPVDPSILAMEEDIRQLEEEEEIAQRQRVSAQPLLLKNV